MTDHIQDMQTEAVHKSMVHQMVNTILRPMALAYYQNAKFVFDFIKTTKKPDGVSVAAHLDFTAILRGTVFVSLVASLIDTMILEFVGDNLSDRRKYLTAIMLQLEGMRDNKAQSIREKVELRGNTTTHAKVLDIQ